MKKKETKTITPEDFQQYLASLSTEELNRVNQQAEELKKVRPNYHAVSTTNDTRNVVLVRNDTKKVWQ